MNRWQDIILLAVLLLLPLQLAGQEMRYRPVSEYRELYWIDETGKELSEYEISDWRVEDLFNKFIHSETNQCYFMTDLHQHGNKVELAEPGKITIFKTKIPMS